MKNALVGKTILWTFSEGQMANKSFLHSFANDGTVRYQMMKGDEAGPMSEPVKCELASVGQNVGVVSYRVDKGYTLTVVLDFTTKKLVAFSSNADRLDMQQGTFEVWVGSDRHAPAAHSAH
jgi:hypothetical protein